MKRIIKLCLLIAAGFLLVSCGKVTVGTAQPQNESPSPEATQQVVKSERVQVSGSGNYGIYDITGEFVKKVTNNPIDSDYEAEFKKLNQSKDFSTSAELVLESKYIKIWDTELNSIYNKLLTELNSKEKETLIESQKGWLQYHLKEHDFVKQVFYLRESGPVLGSQGTVQMQQAIKGRIRERTLELMEYYTVLGNDVEFEYKSIKK
ncbi:lysozyme inhibitor LprI family protein [Desulfitobacterium sp. Sab5]|uniref:lysozyme inhibitor LprI family protein n=1 Tax=Desulfitobacterium nosdiversum TaxID=3375356 RepID=UPI003CF07928